MIASIIAYRMAVYFNIAPIDFMINKLPNFSVSLILKALEFAGLTGKETVFDLYCGIGTITLCLTKKAKFVYGVEIVTDAVKNAKENAKINDIQNVEFIEGKSEEIIPSMYKEGIRADVVVVDPPRKGCDNALLDTLIDMKPNKIVYVSCNPSTLARDLKMLVENNFVVKKVQPVDMFPMSMHVETVVLMSRNELSY